MSVRVGRQFIITREDTREQLELECIHLRVAIYLKEPINVLRQSMGDAKRTFNQLKSLDRKIQNIYITAEAWNDNELLEEVRCCTRYKNVYLDAREEYNTQVNKKLGCISDGRKLHYCT